MAGADGGVFDYGHAVNYGSLPALGVNVSDVKTIVSTGDGKGYWLGATDGGIFGFGDAHFYGSLPALNVHVSDVVGQAPTSDGAGYWLVGADGGVFAFGDAGYIGSLPALNVHVSDIVGIVPTADGGGYWLVGADGGVFAFGDAGYIGSLPALNVHVSDIVGITPTADNKGYWLVGADGGVFAFGDAGFIGSLPSLGVKVSNVVWIVPTADALGYMLASSTGGGSPSAMPSSPGRHRTPASRTSSGSRPARLVRRSGREGPSSCGAAGADDDRAPATLGRGVSPDRGHHLRLHQGPGGTHRALVRVSMALVVIVATFVGLGTLGHAAMPAGADPIADCSTTQGDIVAVDFSPWGGNIERGCAATLSTGYAALQAAGFISAGDQHDGPGFVCRINDDPPPSQDPCVNTPPDTAYCCTCMPTPAQDTWSYSQLGAATYRPPPGSVDVWVFGATNVQGTDGQPSFSPAQIRAMAIQPPPPRYRPRPPRRPPAPPTTPLAHPTSAVTPPRHFADLTAERVRWYGTAHAGTTVPAAGTATTTTSTTAPPTSTTVPGNGGVTDPPRARGRDPRSSMPRRRWPSSRRPDRPPLRDRWRDRAGAGSGRRDRRLAASTAARRG